MAEYVYEGPDPVEDPDGDGIVRPGDVREYDEEPGWGPWRRVLDPGDVAPALVIGPDGPRKTPEPPAAGPPALAAGPPPAPKGE